MPSLKINGAEKHFAESLPESIAELLDRLGINHATVVAEIDGKIIKRKEFGQTKLRSGQSIELVRFVGGG